jgi:hypothetical protein
VHCCEAFVTYFQKLSVFIFYEFFNLLPSYSFKRIYSHSIVQVIESIVYHYSCISSRIFSLNVQQLHISISSGIILLYLNFSILYVGDSFDSLHELVDGVCALELAVVLTVGLELHLIVPVRHLSHQQLLLHREFLLPHDLCVIGYLV